MVVFAVLDERPQRPCNLGVRLMVELCAREPNPLKAPLICVDYHTPPGADSQWAVLDRRINGRRGSEGHITWLVPHSHMSLVAAHV